MNWIIAVAYGLTGGCLIGLGTRDNVSLWVGVPMILVGFRMADIGLWHLQKVKEPTP